MDNPNYIHIEGVVEANIKNDEFIDKFIDWIEKNGWSFGGGTWDEDEDGNPIK